MSQQTLSRNNSAQSTGSSSGRSSTPTSPQRIEKKPRTIGLTMIPKFLVREHWTNLNAPYKNNKILFSNVETEETLQELRDLILYKSKLKYRNNTEYVVQSGLLDLDDPEAKMNCQLLLNSISALLTAKRLVCRKFRNNYSLSYKNLLSGQSYLNDILDTAQEARSCMWVNNEKYVFSETVLARGITLY